MVQQCSDLKDDRRIGEYWERQFCVMARDYGFMFTPMQIGHEGSAVAYKGQSWNTYTLPDVTIWTYPGQYHEIKHKNPTKKGSFGLEEYRLKALLAFAEETQQDVMYTIHNHDLTGGKEELVNAIDHWVTVNVNSLVGTQAGTWNGASWVDGVKRFVPICYWPAELWQPLTEYWQEMEMPL